MKNSHLFEALLTKVWAIWAWPPLDSYFGGWAENKGLDRFADEGCAAAKIGQDQEKPMRNSHLFEAGSTPSWPNWARSGTDWAAVPRRMRQEFSPIPHIADNPFLFSGDISTNTAPLGNPVQALIKCVENTRRYPVSPLFFSCFTGFSEPTQFHSAIKFGP